MDAVARLKLIKLFGDLMAHPERILEQFSLHIEQNEPGILTGRFTVTGDLAETLKEFKPHVQRTLEKTEKA